MTYVTLNFKCFFASIWCIFKFVLVVYLALPIDPVPMIILQSLLQYLRHGQGHLLHLKFLLYVLLLNQVLLHFK